MPRPDIEDQEWLAQRTAAESSIAGRPVRRHVSVSRTYVGGGGRMATIVRDDGGLVVAECNLIYAAEILRCVNSHDALLAALDRMLVGITGESTPTCDWYEGIAEDTIEQARAALKSAEG